MFQLGDTVVNSPHLVMLDKLSLGPHLDFKNLTHLSVNLTEYEHTEPHQVIERCKDADIIITNKVKLTAECFMQSKVSLVCVAATGTNNIDMDAAQKLGINIKNVKDYAGVSVAQHVFALITCLFNRVPEYNQLVKQGNWAKSPYFCMFDYPITELAGKTLGIIGYGKLAKSVINVANAFDMKVMVAERKDAITIRTKRYDFEEVIKNADVLSIHCPLTDETKELIASEQLNSMKSSAIIINTARGGIINEFDLLAALENKRIAGVATDVLSEEPPRNGNPLLSYQGDNLIITPHIAWASQQARQRLLNQVIANIRDFIDLGRWR